MPVLCEWVEEQTKQRIQNIASRGIKLPLEEIYWVLGQMGSVMSLHKVHRKIALTYAVLKDMEIGQVLSAEILANMSNKYIRGQNANIDARAVGNLMRCLKKWGYVEVLPVVRSGEFQNRRMYRRIA